MNTLEKRKIICARNRCGDKFSRWWLDVPQVGNLPLLTKSPDNLEWTISKTPLDEIWRGHFGVRKINISRLTKSGNVVNVMFWRKKCVHENVCKLPQHYIGLTSYIFPWSSGTENNLLCVFVCPRLRGLWCEKKEHMICSFFPLHLRGLTEDGPTHSFGERESLFWGTFAITNNSGSGMEVDSSFKTNIILRKTSSLQIMELQKRVIYNRMNFYRPKNCRQRISQSGDFLFGTLLRRRTLGWAEGTTRVCGFLAFFKDYPNFVQFSGGIGIENYFLSLNFANYIALWQMPKSIPSNNLSTAHLVPSDSIDHMRRD